MNSFAIALASIALVLLNMGVGWFLAKQHSRGHLGPAVRRLFHRDKSAE